MHLSCFLLRSLDRTPQCRLPVYVALWHFYRTTCNGLNPWVFGKTLESIPTDTLIVLSHSNPLAGIQHSDDSPLCWLSACLLGLHFCNANSSLVTMNSLYHHYWFYPNDHKQPCQLVRLESLNAYTVSIFRLCRLTSMLTGWVFPNRIHYALCTSAPTDCSLCTQLNSGQQLTG